MDGGAIGVAPNGTVTTAWRRDRKVFLAQPGKPEIELGDGVQPWIASDPEGDFVAWERDGKIVGTSGGKPQTLRAGTRPAVGLVGGRGMTVWADESGTLSSQRL